MSYLRDIRIAKGFTQTEVADYLGLTSSQAYGYYETGKRKLSVEKAKKLADFFKVPLTYIISEYDSSNNVVQELGVKVPIVGTIAAGTPILATENIEDYEFVPARVIKPNHNYFFLRVKGDSMNMRFQNGDIVLIDQIPNLEDGEIGAFLVNSETATLKKLSRKNGLIILNPMSTNPTHQPQIYDPNETEITCIGKAIAYQGVLN